MSRIIQRNTEAALRYLATQMMNQVGETWEDCCNSAEIVANRLRARGVGEESLSGHLYAEAYRYEDM